jgi:hypothetical protein
VEGPLRRGNFVSLLGFVLILIFAFIILFTSPIALNLQSLQNHLFCVFLFALNVCISRFTFPLSPFPLSTFCSQRRSGSG